MKRIDLHTHSTYSDGTLTPAELIAMAAGAGIAALAITDHDTTAGVAEALDCGDQAAVAVLPAVEISASLNDLPLHLLGYGLDVHDAALNALLVRIQQARKTRNLGITARLAELGIGIDLAALEKDCHGQVGRPHFARKLVAAGKASSVQDAFIRLLRRGGRAYVARRKLAAEEAVATITAAGGLAVLAHPASLDPSLAKLAGVIRALKPYGLAGLEVYYPTHSRGIRAKLLDCCRAYGLLATGGSDYHGNTTDGVTLGFTADAAGIPFDLYERMLELLPRRP